MLPVRGIIFLQNLHILLLFLHFILRQKLNPCSWVRLEETSHFTHKASGLMELLSSAYPYPKSCGKLLWPFLAIGAIVSSKLDKTLVEADAPGCHTLRFLTVCHPSSCGVFCLWVQIRSHTPQCQGSFKHYFCFQGGKREIPSSASQLVATGMSDTWQKPGLAHGKYRDLSSGLKRPKCLLLVFVNK